MAALVYSFKNSLKISHQMAGRKVVERYFRYLTPGGSTSST
jgi:hypothetical protein